MATKWLAALVAIRQSRLGDGPDNTDVGIVPPDRAFGSRVVNAGAFVHDVGDVATSDGSCDQGRPVSMKFDAVMVVAAVAKFETGLATGEAPPVDPDRTKLFFDASVGNSYLRVNLKGREPTGVVDADEYDTLLQEIEHELYALVNAATGQPVIKHVYFPWRMYKGEKRDHLPDVSVLWNAESKVDAIQSETIGVVAKPFVDKRSGNHTTDAFLLCRGPAFVSGQARVEADARQLAPTVFHLLGAERPEHYEVGPLFDVLQPPQSAGLSRTRIRARTR